MYAVIGANYGDEGKGLVSCALCREANRNNQSVLNVLTNGGCQRGHTAYDSMGNRHVYSHLGSGYPYADIYFSKHYMLNPMVFVDEYNKYNDWTGNVYCNNIIIVDPECTLTLPYDMLVNRMIENKRTNRHGSCGYGIWETVCRNKTSPVIYCYTLGQTKEELIKMFTSIRDNYYPAILEKYEIKMSDDERALFYSDILIRNYVNDLITMQQITSINYFMCLVNDYDTIVFENAQGLLLDQDVDDWGTPSKTGMAYIRDIVGKSQKVTPYYVTRTYLTKHGNGIFPEECPKYEINAHMEDNTNQPNQYQGTLRYGKFSDRSISDLLERIRCDAGNSDYKLVVTHVNEYYDERLIQHADFISEDEISFFERKDGILNFETFSW